MSKIAEIMEKLETLTLLEAAELVEKIEETFGVDASASGGTMVMAATGGAAVATPFAQGPGGGPEGAAAAGESMAGLRCVRLLHGQVPRLTGKVCGCRQSQEWC